MAHLSGIDNAESSAARLAGNEPCYRGRPWRQTATVYSFEIELAHVDRGVYASLAFRVAQHPSEADDALLARVLAYCLEYQTGIQFSSRAVGA